MTDTRTWVLWGFHPRYGGPLGIVPLRLSGGTLREVRSAQKQRENDGGWTLGIYASGEPPVGLRLQCHEKYGTPALPESD